MHRPNATILLFLLLLSSACAATPDAGVQLDGRDFVLTALTVDGRPGQLVPGTQVRISFADGSLGANAGCNHLGADYEVRDGHLTAGAMSMTEMGCDRARHDQDQWLADLLSSRPRLSLDGNGLVLDAGETVATFRDRTSVEPDQPLAGTRWELMTIIDGDTARSVPGDVLSTLQLSEDGTLQVVPGCNTGSGTYQKGAGTISFGAIAVTRMACPGERDDVERTVLAVLSGDVEYEISSGTLTLRAGERGLQYRAG
jgi:heat shock protein HslJ